MIFIHTVASMVDQTIPPLSPWIIRSRSSQVYQEKISTSYIDTTLDFWPVRLAELSPALATDLGEVSYKIHSVESHHICEYVVDGLLKFTDRAVRATYQDAFKSRAEQIEWAEKNCKYHFEPVEDVEAVKRCDRRERLMIEFENPEDEVIFRLRWL